VKLKNAITGMLPAQRIPETVSRMLRLLEALPDGEYLTTRQVARSLGWTDSAIRSHLYHPAVVPHKAPSPEHPRGVALCNLKTAQQVRKSHDRP